MRRALAAGTLGMWMIACGGASDATPPPVAPPPPAPVTPPPVEPAPAPAPVVATPAPLSPAEARAATFKAMVDAINAHDPDKVAAAYSLSGSVVDAGSPPVVGHEAIAASMKSSFASFPDMKMGLRRLFWKDDTLVVEWTITGTNTGPGVGGSPSSGRPVGMNGASIFFFDGDGLVKEEHEYADAATMLAQIGLTPVGGRPVAVVPSGEPETHVAKGSMDEAKNVELVKAIDHSFETRDEKAFAAANADDVTWDDYATPAPTQGKKAQLQTFKVDTTAFPKMKLDCQVWGFDDWAAQECTYTGKNSGPIVLGPKMKVPPTNRDVSFHTVDVVQIKDGKAVHGFSYSNSLELGSQLSGPPMPAGAKTSEPKPADSKKTPTKPAAGAASPSTK